MDHTPLRNSNKNFFAGDDDEDVGEEDDDSEHMTEKKLLSVESDFDMSEVKNIPSAKTAGEMRASKQKEILDYIFNNHQTDAGDDIERFDTIDAFVGPVKNEFNDLKNKIDK